MIVLSYSVPSATDCSKTRLCYTMSEREGPSGRASELSRARAGGRAIAKRSERGYTCRQTQTPVKVVRRLTLFFARFALRRRSLCRAVAFLPGVPSSNVTRLVLPLEGLADVLEWSVIRTSRCD
jgi:hypothetical protein